MATAPPAALNRAVPVTVSGSIVPGMHRQVISEGVATRTLLPEESGSLCLFDTAAGVVYTLPAPVVGMQFNFGISVEGTGSYKIITNSASVFLTGGLFLVSLTVAEAGDTFVANGSTHVAITMDADTEGRIKGSMDIRLTAISATQWHVSGFATGAGTLSDPFATS
jgi:hypothetical protein